PLRDTLDVYVTKRPTRVHIRLPHDHAGAGGWLGGAGAAEGRREARAGGEPV
ncbi:hypothetical protein C0992_005933, partial [Termitomyces sp. T32_za158]